MAHVELSLSESLTSAELAPAGLTPAGRPVPSSGGPLSGGPLSTGLDRWAEAVVSASEPCMVVGKLSEIVAISPSASRLLGFSSPAAAVTRHLYGNVLPLLDFTSQPDKLAESELDKIPPLLAYSSGRLARGLLRVRVNGEVITVDAVATPLFDQTGVAGSLTFFCRI